ncbi:hypothetical protein HPB50_024989 [Hyalomma asiaticum]|uniref:Uncharacterized protein n=1 Tax=Hyalomma asiaticum TaxID=266040 RepID=A0ACB7SCN2_HYAAI|nr:hypothetical protein HPB50_024989 [Hyalomma asiaticum]
MRAPMALDLEKQRAPSPGRPGSPASSERRLKVTADGASAPQQHQQPAAQPAAPAAGSTPPLKFSIERILSSEFGPTGGRSVPPAAAVVTAKESQQPRKEDRTKPITDGATTPPQPNQPGLLWPAWVYCTRYSDRPSSAHGSSLSHLVPLTRGSAIACMGGLQLLTIIGSSLPRGELITAACAICALFVRTGWHPRVWSSVGWVREQHTLRDSDYTPPLLGAPYPRCDQRGFGFYGMPAWAPPPKGPKGTL